MMRAVILMCFIVVSFAGVLAYEDDKIESIIKLYDSKADSANKKDCRKPEVNGEGIYFNFYTRERFLYNQTLKEMMNEQTFSAYYHVNKVTKILVHGWHGYSGMKPFQEMVYDYLYTQDVNVISMDWSVYARKCNLKSVFSDVTTVSGEMLAKMLNALLSRDGADANKFHIVAFGVGAHIAAVAAKMIQQPQMIGRITALEPMGLRYDYPGYARLETGDAQLVDVIYTTKEHSSGRDVGHIVFYPEGGYHPQPDSGSEEMSSAYRSIFYFKRSILTPYAYPAKRIEHDFNGSRPEREDEGTTYTPDNYMGEYVEPSKPGKYYVNVKGLPLHTLRGGISN